MRGKKPANLMPTDTSDVRKTNCLQSKEPFAKGSKLKIIFLNRFYYPDYSATSQLLTELTFYLAESGFDVWVITSRMRYDHPEADLSADERVKGVRVLRVWTSRFGRGTSFGRILDYLTFHVSCLYKLFQYLSQNDIIVAKTDPPLLSVIAAFAARVKGAKLINWLQDLFPEIAIALGIRFFGGPVHSVLLRLRNNSLISADMNVVINHNMAKHIRHLGIDDRQLKVISNWADGSRIRPIDKAKNTLCREWNLQDKFVVGYSGNMGRAHEFATMLDAAEKLVHNARVVFLLIGGGRQFAWIKDEIKRRNLRNVCLKPYQAQDRLAESLCVPDVHVVSLLPALEGIVAPSKFYGAMAAGRPIFYIGDSQSEMGKNLVENKSGYAIGIGRSENLVQKLISLEKDDNLCRQMGKNGRVAFENNFDKKYAMTVWKETLEGVMHQ